MIQIPLNIKLEKNLTIFFCGYEKTKKGHSVGPYVIDPYLFHIIHSGRGKLITQNKEYNLSAGMGFIIFPNQVAQYISSQDDPFEYSWISFKGSKMKDILFETSLSTNRNDFIHLNFDFYKYFSYENKNSFHMPLTKILDLKSHTYSFFKELINSNPNESIIEEKKQMNEYIQAVENIVNTNFHNKITVNSIAKQVGLNMSYLGQIFKKEKGMTIKDFLTITRIERACELLENTELEISNISRSVGYKDQLQFSKIFKKYKSLSPSKYRKRV